MRNIEQQKYKENKLYWGFHPDKGLREAIKLAKKGLALDIGAGQGRNSLFLTRQGFEVETIDKNAESLKICKEYAKKYNLPIKSKLIDIKKFKFPKEKYDLVVSVTAIDFFRLSEIKKLLAKIKKSLKKGGIFYLVVFSVNDPSFKKIKDRGVKMIEENTFYFPKIKTARHYFQKRELKGLLKDFKILKIEESKQDARKKAYFHNTIGVIVEKR